MLLCIQFITAIKQPPNLKRRSEMRNQILDFANAEYTAIPKSKIKWDKNILKIDKDLRFFITSDFDLETSSIALLLEIHDENSNVFFAEEFEDCLNTKIISEKFLVSLKDLLSLDFIWSLEVSVSNILTKSATIEIERIGIREIRFVLIIAPSITDQIFDQFVTTQTVDLSKLTPYIKPK